MLMLIIVEKRQGRGLTKGWSLRPPDQVILLSPHLLKLFLCKVLKHHWASNIGPNCSDWTQGWCPISFDSAPRDFSVWWTLTTFPEEKYSARSLEYFFFWEWQPWSSSEPCCFHLFWSESVPRTLLRGTVGQSSGNLSDKHKSLVICHCSLKRLSVYWMQSTLLVWEVFLRILIFL